MSKLNTFKYIQNFIQIRNKDLKTVPFKLNKPQIKLYNAIKEMDDKPIRIIVLKARQMGFSTLTSAIILKNVATRRNAQAGIVAHKEDASTNLFNMYKSMYDSIPDPIKPECRASNAKELIFDNANGTGLKSRIRCMTAGSKGIGRSFTMNYLHISELAFWEGDVKATLLGLFQSVPNKKGTMIIIESTANGYEHFKELWDMAVRGESDFKPVFVGWNELPEYEMPYSGFELTPEEIRLKDTYSLTNEQLEWRRWCIKNNCGGDINQFKQEYPICPDEAFISTGTCVFDQDKIINRLAELRGPLYECEFNYKYDGLKILDIKKEILKKGQIRVWEEPIPQHCYVIGCDTAGEGSDYFYAHVLDNYSGKEVAVYRNPTDETLFARQIYCLGKYYNDALISVETNFSTYPVRELERLGYKNMFVRQKEDSYTHQYINSYGFKTTSLTRPIIISMVGDIIREHIELINDDILLKECLTFVRNEQGRAEAMVGKHDDGVMSYGITLYARTEQKIIVVEQKKMERRFKWSEDLKEDYRKADKNLRERMIEKYGQPN